MNKSLGGRSKAPVMQRLQSLAPDLGAASTPGHRPWAQGWPPEGPGMLTKRLHHWMQDQTSILDHVHGMPDSAPGL